MKKWRNSRPCNIFKTMPLTALLLCHALSGCADNKEVHRFELISWNGVAVEELDNHYMFSKIHMVKTLTDTGIEIRDYMNKPGINSCDKYGLVNGYMSFSDFMAFKGCTSLLTGCDNNFYIRNGKVIKFEPVGNCYTDEFSRP